MKPRAIMRTLGLLVVLAGLLAGCGNDDIVQLADNEGLLNPPPGAKASIPFLETFQNNNWGWSLDPEWEIGPATTHIPSDPITFSPDPGTDVTPTSDNGIAGVVIGGEYSAPLHPFYYLTSPPLDASGVTGTLLFGFYRWLNSDYPNYMDNVVEVFDGVSWITLWQGPAPGVFINESSWSLYNYDITPYVNPALRVRFGFNVGTGGLALAGGWNVDDVAIVEF